METWPCVEGLQLPDSRADLVHGHAESCARGCVLDLAVYLVLSCISCTAVLHCLSRRLIVGGKLSIFNSAGTHMCLGRVRSC